MSKVYYTSPFGLAHYPWINKPDTKYNPDGLYHVSVVMEPSAEVDSFVEFVTGESQKAFEEEGEKLTPADKKKYTLYVPVEKEVDPTTGEETGNWVAHFKQNHIIKKRDGTLIEVKIGVKDASGRRDVRKPLFAGTELRVMYSPRPIKMSGTKEIGVRLDFASVQVRKLAEPSGGRGFSAIEGYEEDQSNFDPAEGPTPLPGSEY